MNVVTQDIYIYTRVCVCVCLCMYIYFPPQDIVMFIVHVHILTETADILA